MKPQHIYAFKCFSANEVLLINKNHDENPKLQADDAIKYALKYSGSKQIIFENMFDYCFCALESILEKNKNSSAEYDNCVHGFKFQNGSTIELGFMSDSEDYMAYLSCRYNVVRFVECTNFTRRQVLFMQSRIRGSIVNNYPCQLKLTSVHYKRQKDFIKSMFFQAFRNPNVINKKYYDADIERKYGVNSIVILCEGGEEIE